MQPSSACVIGTSFCSSVLTEPFPGTVTEGVTPLFPLEIRFSFFIESFQAFLVVIAVIDNAA